MQTYTVLIEGKALWDGASLPFIASYYSLDAQSVKRIETMSASVTIYSAIGVRSITVRRNV